MLQGVARVANASAGMGSGCMARHPGAEWRCLYVNETLGDITTPTFAVQQQASIFDTQCNIAAEVISVDAGRDAILMVQCIAGRGQWHICFQYSERCTAAQLTGVVAPFQQQYVDDYTRGNFHAKPGNGGFFHSCHLGAYWETGWRKPEPAGAKWTSMWNQIKLDGYGAKGPRAGTMQAAISAWWGSDPKLVGNFSSDCLWEKPIGEHLGRPMYCNPSCDGFPFY